MLLPTYLHTDTSGIHRRISTLNNQESLLCKRGKDRQDLLCSAEEKHSWSITTNFPVGIGYRYASMLLTSLVPLQRLRGVRTSFRK